FDKMGEVGGAGVALHALVVVLLVLALLASAGSILITLYNTISNPYETYMGPIGLYACSGLS
ncbi:clarin-3, partial [Clarias magur]